MEKQKISILFPADVLQQIRDLAEEHERSFNGEVVWALKQYASDQRIAELENTVAELKAQQQTMQAEIEKLKGEKSYGALWDVNPGRPDFVLHKQKENKEGGDTLNITSEMVEAWENPKTKTKEEVIEWLQDYFKVPPTKERTGTWRHKRVYEDTTYYVVEPKSWPPEEESEDK